MRRREFLVRLAAGGAAVFAARELAAQDAAPPQGATSNLFDMNQDAARRVLRPAKPGAVPTMTDDQRDAMEHQLRCQCGCTLDVYTCRTTDFSCQVSPAMHRDVMALVAGGYSAPEIIDAFVDSYGERVLMAPKKEGFNWAGYVAPFVAIAAGGSVVAAMLRRWRARAVVVTPASRADLHADVDATPDELARLDAAVRGEQA